MVWLLAISECVDKGENILMPLVKFNLGVEVGQIIILLVALSLFSMGRAME